MSFLQPALLLALPLMVLPIVIHLINQRRYQTMPWAAMQFLLTATRMSRGFARIRQWLILLLRTLVIGALLLAVSRPLASGRFSFAGRADTTIILLDRSPSMMLKVAGVSKWNAAARQLASALQTMGSARWILLDSASGTAREIASPDALWELPDARPTSAASNIPAMLQAAHDYIETNQTGRTEIWIASDLRANDWHAESGLWRELRNGFMEFAQSVRIHLLAYPQVVPENIALRVPKLQRISTGDTGELSISLDFTREDIFSAPIAHAERAARDSGEAGAEEDRRTDWPITFPVQFEVDGARTELTVEMAGSHYALKDHRIALARHQQSGWGRVSIPTDANKADNDFYFVFDTPAPRHTLVVSDNVQIANLLKLAASISPDSAIRCQAEVVPAGQLATAAWGETGLLLWQMPLPVGTTATLVHSFVEQGGQVLFLPPHEQAGGEWSGVRWGSWIDGRRAVTSWRGDEGLLANTQSGAALPVGKLAVHKYCTLSGDVTPLATLDGGDPLLARITTDHGGVYFLATTPANSSLASQGVMWYVVIQRALAKGATRLEATHNLVAGESSRWTTESLQVPKSVSAESTESLASTQSLIEWHQLAGNQEIISTAYAEHQGVYETGGTLLAVNRPIAEDHARVLTDTQVRELFVGLDFVRIDGSPGNDRGMIEEIWRMFLAMMMIAMLIEAVLCMPRRSVTRSLVLSKGAVS
jgi:hypothetical protein